MTGSPPTNPTPPEFPPRTGPASAAFHTRIEGFPLGPFQTNCYILSAPPPTTECWIIDASFSPQPLINRIRQRGLTPSRIILTHAHIDHIAGLDDLREAFGPLPVSIHGAEAAFLGDPELNLSAPYGLPFSTAGPDDLLQGGETLTIAGERWLVLHTPGHSPGGITLWNEPAALALVGDTLFAGAIGRSDFPTSDEAALHRSIREVLYRLPDQTTIYPGHGPTSTIGREKRSNPFVRA